MTERLSAQGSTLLIRENFGVTPAFVTRTVLAFGPSKYAEIWNVSRVTIRGSMFSNWGLVTLPQPTIKIWRGAPGGYLLDKVGPIDPLQDPGKSELDYVTSTGFTVSSGETVYIESVWRPPIAIGGTKIDSWSIDFYLEGTITRAINQ